MSPTTFARCAPGSCPTKRRRRSRPPRVSFVISLFDRRLNFVETFMKTRNKLLELVTVDRWPKEMLEILDETGTCPQCGTLLNQRKLIQRRVWQKMSPATRAGLIDPDSEPEDATTSIAETEPDFPGSTLDAGSA